MMSVSDLFYGGREPVWIVHTPNAGQKSASNMNHPTPQSVSRVMSGEGLRYNSVVELKVPVCCEACEDRVKHKLLNFVGVESVKCDCITQRVIVTGNAAPADLLRICKKLHKRSELVQKKGPQNGLMMTSPKW